MCFVSTRGFVEAEIGRPAGEFVLFTVRRDRWPTFDFAGEAGVGAKIHPNIRLMHRGSGAMTTYNYTGAHDHANRRPEKT